MVSTTGVISQLVTLLGCSQNRESLKTGVCRAGMMVCQQQADGSFDYGPECLGEVIPSDEICDGLDNDCNGLPDDLAELGNPCTTLPELLEVGECQPGTLQCTDQAPEPLCVGEVVPEEELCDELDNDCDGQTDENLGRCDCENPLYVPRPETCNGVDDDCDGIIDNERPNLNVRLSTMCYTNPEGTVPSRTTRFPPEPAVCRGKGSLRTKRRRRQRLLSLRRRNLAWERKMQWLGR